MTLNEKIERYKSFGFLPYKRMKGEPVKVVNCYLGGNGTMNFVLQPKEGDRFEMNIKVDKIDNFFSDFEAPESLPPITIPEQVAEQEDSPLPVKTEEKAVAKKSITNNGDDFAILRGHLFSTMDKLRNGTMKAAEAKSMASVAQAIINSQKVELQFRGHISNQNKESGETKS